MSNYTELMRDTQPLSKQEELEFLVKAQTDDEYRGIIISGFVRLVHAIARPYFKDGIDPDDLVQEGIKGLHRAIDDFKPEKNKRFATYARWWVKHFVTQYYRSNIRGFKISGNISGELYKMSQATDVFEQENGRGPTPEEMAVSLNYDVGYVNYLYNFANNTISLDALIQADTGLGKSAVFPDNTIDTPYERVAREDSVARVKKCLSDLPEKERTVLVYRYGLDGENPLTLQKIGAKMGLTAEWVRQLQISAEKNLKESIYK